MILSMYTFQTYVHVFLNFTVHNQVYAFLLPTSVMVGDSVLLVMMNDCVILSEYILWNQSNLFNYRSSGPECYFQVPLFELKEV